MFGDPYPSVITLPETDRLRFFPENVTIVGHIGRHLKIIRHLVVDPAVNNRQVIVYTYFNSPYRLGWPSYPGISFIRLYAGRHLHLRYATVIHPEAKQDHFIMITF